MSEEQQIVLMLKGLLEQMTSDQRARYDKAYADIKAIIEQGDPERMALIVHGAELNAQ
ncbi:MULTISPECIES: hypothetical protein [Pseudomonas putida group]|uniref:hypothetical protein n=1 Tax=Pseudomonas putida group TaxID=136845 RepID=UPI00156DAA46|nr:MULTISPECIES: hypothetical protein [Pseudomonas putida group]MCE0989321.1 hypothetical protein [Pseudomonas alloputida]